MSRRDAHADWAVVFDLDGVIADTARLHRQSWETLAQRHDVPFDERMNDRMRGLTRPQSLAVFLEAAPRAFSPGEQNELIQAKNDEYLRLVADLAPGDELPGIRPLLEDLRRHGIAAAVASSSRNVRIVLERLELVDFFTALIDAHAAPRSKPDPQAFALAAQALGQSPARCVAIEDGAAGVAAARAAGMAVIGVGPRERLGEPDEVVASTMELTVDRLRRLLK
jgi:alpha,alpha-trehalose phosphorylase